MSVHEDPRYPRTATIAKDRIIRGTTDLVIRVNTSQSVSLDLTDDELRSLRDVIDEYLEGQP